jgi:SAM-dependent MidA family methyltransferase
MNPSRASRERPEPGDPAAHEDGDARHDRERRNADTPPDVRGHPATQGHGATRQVSGAPEPSVVSSVVAGVRRIRLPDPTSVGEDEELVRLLRAEIEAVGPITFARFMERALYEPGHGYYRRRQPAPGMAGDFLTAPETHPIFGAAVGRLLEQAWAAMGQPHPFVISEPGAGTGALAEGLLAGLRDTGSPLAEVVRYRPVELDTARAEAVHTRLAAAGLDRYLATDQVEDHAATPVGGSQGGAATSAETGAVVANEVLDALPVHRVVGRSHGIRELVVNVDAAGGFVQAEAEPTTPALAMRLAAEEITLGEGQVAEVCLATDGWLADATRSLARGLVLLIDYGEEPVDLYAPRRVGGTLRAFARHAVGGDPYRHVGRQDLTATVDLAAVRAAARRAGLTAVGETTQAELLAAVGTGDLTTSYLRRPGAGLADALLLRSAVARLLDPRGMGAFRVLAFGRGLPHGVRLPGLERLTRPG